MRLLTGTSGFAYKEWKPEFYPKDLPASEMLRYYAERFPAVEINSTFFRMPSSAQLEQWAAEVPPDFVFALKAPQEITHRKRLKDVAEPVARLFDAAAVLGERLGPVLFQLPPNMKKDAARLESLLQLIPEGARAAVEFRHASWLDDEVYGLLRAGGAALCIAEGEGADAPPIATAGWGYLRLRRVGYDEGDLAAWANSIRARADDWSDAYVFFKHEDTATGPRHARRLAELCG